MAYQVNEKKKALLAYKEEILKDIKYFEKRIEEARSEKTNLSYFDDDDDSDSELFATLDTGPSVHELKLQETRLQTCLHATQELTSLCILQSEVNVMVNDPVYEREPPVTEAGTWREVTADCKVDLVPFSITFYVHQSSRPFGPVSYRGLRVVPVKAAHENELAKSILPRVATPSDAVEVLRSYAVAHRSRRGTLARLAEKYPDCLFMEPMADGGYVLKCADLLEVSWTLENRRSPVAPFHHKMKFDLEYMDEAYVRIISQAHRELSDPALQCDERTRLMSKIIATCLEARGPTQELYESMESDVETEKLRKRRTTLDQETEEPVNKKKKDSEVMAPPKSLPKKTKPKPKGKENNVDGNKVTKPAKRPVTDGGSDGPKKAKLSKQDGVIEKSVASANNVANKENVDAGKKNSHKEIVKSKPIKEPIVTNRSNRNDVPKDLDSNVRSNADKQNGAALKKASELKSGNVKNVVGSSKSKEKINDGQSKDSNLKKNAEKASHNIGSKKTDDAQVRKDKPIEHKTAADIDNANKTVNVKKTTKIPDIEKDNDKRSSNHVENNSKPDDSNKNTNTKKTKPSNKVATNVEGVNIEKPNNPNKVTDIKKVKSNKAAKNVGEINTGGPKVTTTPTHSEETAQKVSSKHNVVSKNKNFNVNDNISTEKTNSKAKSAGDLKENVARVNENLTKDNNTNKVNVTKTKPTGHMKPSNPTVLNSGNIDPSLNNKNTVTADFIKSKSKDSLNDKAVKVKSNTKSDKNRNMDKVNVEENSNEKPVDRENTKQIKEKPSKSKLTNQDAIKTVKKPNSASKIAIVKQHDTLQKIVVKNSTKPKNVDRVVEKNDMNNIINNGINVAVTRKVTDDNVASVNKKSVQTNKDSGRNPLKETSNNKKTSADSKKPIKQMYTHTKNILNKGIQNKIKLINSKNKISVEKIKLTSNAQKEMEARKENGDLNRTFTKIPRKLMSVREQIVKNNPLRSSPRMLHSNVKANSQDVSKSSQRSLQKPVTGIPRLLKKPIQK